MHDVLPAINCNYKDTAAVSARCRAVEKIFAATNSGASAPAGSVPMAHFDVADGAFTVYKSWDEPELLKDIAPTLAFEAHLMTEDPRAAAARWLAAGARRVIVHAETAAPAEFEEIVRLAAAAGATAALALSPETPAAAAQPYLHLTSEFLVLGVHPGMSGQKFLPTVLQKIIFLRRQVPNARIEVDGGMNEETGRAAIAAGASALVAASDIFGNADPEGEYAKLRAL